MPKSQETERSSYGAACHQAISDFATKSRPLRGSAVPELLRCSLRNYLLELGVIVDGDNVASDTGSALHRAAEIFHKGSKPAAAWKKCLADRAKYPQADFKEVKEMFDGYVRDPRNQTKPVIIEAEVVVELPAWETDPTGTPIYIVGHLDQVRKIDGKLCVVDIKTSKKWGSEILPAYAAQLVIYAMGATKLLKKPVSPGYILRARAYAQKNNADVLEPEGVFFPYEYAVSEVEPLIDMIRREVALVRAEQVGPRPGSGCTYCPAGHVGYCSALLKGVSV